MLIEELLQKQDSYTILLGKKFKKAKVKYSNKPSNIKLLDKLVSDLRNTGEITTNNVHPIKQPLPSAHTGSPETGWKVAWVSRNDDLRLGYLRFKDDKVIEVKFGNAKDIGYDH